MRLIALTFMLLCLGGIAPAYPAPPALGAGGPSSPAFGVAAHPDVNMEWWYVNAHVTTAKGRHLALVGSFFQFGAGMSSFGVGPTFPAHYLIYAVTDLDTKAHRSYSLADRSMQLWLQQFSPLMAASNPHDKAMQHLAAMLAQEEMPPPHQILAGGTATVTDSPFSLVYGYATPEAQNSLTSLNTSNTSFLLHLGGARKTITNKALAGQDEILLTLTSQKPPMAVGGKGQTGLKSPTDMYYFSLTRCAVGGTIDTGAGPEQITGGQGWFDHQWGNSWVASNNGWDWWGVQLDDGTDILFFRQRDLKTGRIFFPLATFMDKNGHQSVTRKIVFMPDPKSLWKSPKSGVTYPLGWAIYFPEKGLALAMAAVVKDQEMPILGPGGGIWEGICKVAAFDMHHPKSLHTHKTGQSYDAKTKRRTITFESTAQPNLAGVAYMELVGYNSPAVKRQLVKRK